MCKLIEWPDYDQADAFRLNKVIFLPLHVVRQLAQAATLVRAERGKLVATPVGKSILSDPKRGSFLAVLFHLAFWRMDLSYFGRGLLGLWPEADAGVVLWSLSVCHALLDQVLATAGLRSAMRVSRPIRCPVKALFGRWRRCFNDGAFGTHGVAQSCPGHAGENRARSRGLLPRTLARLFERAAFQR
jgi:hypothetical protein